MKNNKVVVIFFVANLLLSCVKDSNGPDNPMGGSLSGHIIYEYTSDVKQIDMNTGNERLYFSYNAYSTAGWYTSKDGKLRLISEIQAGNYHQTRFKLVEVADGTIIKEFDYTPLVGNNQRYTGQLSFDNSLIMLQPDFDNGIVIMDTDGEVRYRLDAINGTTLTIRDRAIWLPDNSILVTFDDRYLLKSSAPYTSLTLIKEMNYEQWGNMRVSMDGQRLSLYIGNHIYLMNIDGTDLTQVTESGGSENLAEFSPDGRFLLVGCDYIHAPNAGLSNWRLKIIPADGSTYDLDTGSEVIPVIPNGSSTLVKVGGNTFWRP